MRIGLISDTHLPRAVRTLTELGPQVEQFFSTVDLILHAGDIVTEGVLDWLERLAPVLAATGNNDGFVDSRMQPRQFLEIEGWRIGMAHDLEPESRPLAEIERWVFGRELDILIGGHTHRDHIRHEGRRLLINSGSAVLPRHYETRLGTVGLLELRPDFVRAEILRLGETPGKRNPGEARLLALERALLLDG